jgi:hypothetical protein
MRNQAAVQRLQLSQSEVWGLKTTRGAEPGTPCTKVCIERILVREMIGRCSALSLFGGHAPRFPSTQDLEEILALTGLPLRSGTNCLSARGMRECNQSTLSVLIADFWLCVRFSEQKRESLPEWAIRGLDLPHSGVCWPLEASGDETSQSMPCSLGIISGYMFSAAHGRDSSGFCAETPEDCLRATISSNVELRVTRVCPLKPE